MTKSTVKMSIVVPCLNEEESVPEFIKQTKIVMQKMKLLKETEFIFVDDGSTDNTLGVLRKLAKKDSSIHFISFSRNFGKEAALYAGLEKAKPSK